MAKVIYENEYLIPHWAMCIIHNGDDGGQDSESVAALDKFLESLPANGSGSFSIPDGVEPEFAYTNDVMDLGDDVYNVTYTVFE